MFELARKGILLGIGVIDLTREKAETFVDELVKRGELAQEKRRGAIEELLKGAEEQEKQLTERVRTAVERTVAELGLATKADLEGIEKRLAKLGKRITK
ncbi:MAG: phasin family protein [Candidatus Bipolaricaulia bacterium]